MIFRRTIYFLLVGLGLLGSSAPAQEVPLSAEEFAKLDPFEGTVLGKADRAFAAKDYRVAGAAYDGFLLQYPKSAATAYGMLRKARCLHLDNKRYEAIKAYNAVLDYFPTALPYAGAALYYIGASAWESSDAELAIKAWSEMVTDKDYRKHFLAAGALMQLGDNLQKQGKVAEANVYYEQAAVDFRTSNPPVALDAMARVIRNRLRIQPDAAKLRAFYNRVGTFDQTPRPADEKGKEWQFWDYIFRSIQSQFGNFAANETKQRDQFYRYWADAMAGQFAEWDDFQINLANYQRIYEGDTGKWIERLDQQFRAYQKANDYNRIVKWIQLFAAQKNKMQEYYDKIDFTKMTNPQIIELMRVLFDQVHDNAMAHNAFEKLHLEQMNDDEKYHLGRYLWSHDEAATERVAQSLTDKDRGQMELFRYYHYRRNLGKALPLAEVLVKIPALAREVDWLKAELLQNAGKFAEAIAAYQAADNPPQNLWRITDCYLGLQKREQAVAQLREIENFFQTEASAAALRIAYLQRDSGDKKIYIAALRAVMKKYPKSEQSNAAHLELERLGVKVGGGVDAE